MNGGPTTGSPATVISTTGIPMLGDTGTIVTAGGALIGVLLLVVIAARLIRMGGWAPRARPGKLLALRESIALDTKRRLHLVQCGDQQVMLLTGGTQDVVVGWLDASHTSQTGITASGGTA